MTGLIANESMLNLAEGIKVNILSHRYNLSDKNINNVVSADDLSVFYWNRQH